jgi:ferrous iron transport protein B
MDAIKGAMAGLGGWTLAHMDDGPLRSLLIDGVIAGVGGVLVFLPQILILFFFILMLEDSGYLPRAAFLLDNLMGRVGLSGRAFIPLLSSFACAVPGIMATRTITHWKDRLATIMVAPLMTCRSSMAESQSLPITSSTCVFQWTVMAGLASTRSAMAALARSLSPQRD